MRMVVLAVVFTTLMVYGEKPKPKTDAHGHDAADAIQQTDGAAGRTVIVVNQQTPQGQQEDHPSKPPNDFSRLFSPENLPNIALVIVAAITGWFIAQQAKETAKATQAMRDSVDVLIKKERARIRVEVENLKLVGSNQAGKFNAALCKLMNYGYTEAFIDDFRAILLLVPEKDIPANYAKCKQLQFGQSIPPQGRSPNFMMVFLEPDMVLTDVAVMSIKKNESFVHFYGFVKYRTVFDRRMRATVHLRWTMQWGGMIQGQIMEWWEAVGPPEENSDTEDKEPN